MVLEKRKLQLRNADEVIAEIKRLRGGYARAGNWSLPQICWHLNIILRYTMSPGPHAPAQADPAARERLAHALVTGEVSGIKAPERVVPPDNAGEESIDALLESLERLKIFPGPFAPHRLFGELSHEDYLRVHFIHASHHLGHLIPAG